MSSMFSSSATSSSPTARSSPVAATTVILNNGSVGGGATNVNKLANRLNSIGSSNINGNRASPTPSSPTSPLQLQNAGKKISGSNGGKLLTVNLVDNTNGVACSLVKSNTNIYYNLKVDSIASKAIHYCDHCTNPDCRAIHKSLTKPLSQVSSPRIYLAPGSSSLSSTPIGTKGANINFIFERRYPLVQLNGNLLNTAIAAGAEGRSISPSQQPSLQPPSQRILIRPHQSGDESAPSFPLPISPTSLHHAVAAAAALAHAQSNADPTKPATFCINFNRQGVQAQSSPSQRTPAQASLISASSGVASTPPKSPFPADSTELQEALSLFPTANINNPRYKNTMFLDQFNNKEQRPQSPTSGSGPLSVRDIANEKYSGSSAANAANSASTNNQLKHGAATPTSNVASAAQPFSLSSKQQPTIATAAKPQTPASTTGGVNQQTNNKNGPCANDVIMQRTLSNNEQLGSNKLKPTFSTIGEANVTNSSAKTQQGTLSSPEISQLKQQLHGRQLNESSASPTTPTHRTDKSANKGHGRQLQQISVPQFYFPHGRHDERQFRSADDTEVMKQLNTEFKSKKEGKMFKEDFGEVTKLLGLPCYWKILLFRACTNTNKLNYVTYSILEQVWSKLTSSCYERATLFVKLISSGGNSVVYEDWEPLLQDIVDSHPGLKFLHDHKEFHTRYIKTVIARIYYTVNRSWSGKITVTELKKSNFLEILESLEYEDDINLIKDYFSYEHFYVIYCKFWELDKDHDLYISREDLYRHNNYSISARVIDRIFSGTVLRGRDWREGLMSYYDFVWFLISEEDKRSTTSIEYWFRVLDLDGDGVLSMYELEFFYNEQMDQMRERQIEYMPFTDLLCQMLDLVKPAEPGKIRLKDLKQCKMANVFLDTFINLEKYLEYEQRDPFSNIRDMDNPDQSDWDKYAAEEYENLVSEDVNGDNGDLYNNYEDDFDDDALLFNNQTTNNLASNGTNGNNTSKSPTQSSGIF